MEGLLVIFDIDGTLCDTFEVDDECFCAVASAMLGVPVDTATWEAAPWVTDAGIVRWLWERYRGRPPSPAETAAFSEAFEAALARELARAPGRFTATRGARPLLDRLRAEGLGVAVATGGWGRTARLKLAAAGLPRELLAASSDDSADRFEIFRLARTRVAGARGRGRSPDTVLVGDGPWDVKVAAGSGWGFLGVGTGGRADRLRACGATRVVPDFTDGEGFLEAVTACEVPRWVEPEQG